MRVLALALLPAILRAYRETDSSLLEHLTLDGNKPRNPEETAESEDKAAKAAKQEDLKVEDSGNDGSDDPPPGPKDTVKPGHENDGDEVPNCKAKKQILSNWDVKFRSIEDLAAAVRAVVRVPSTKADEEDHWKGLAELEEEKQKVIQLFLGAEVSFTADGPGCELKKEDLKLSSGITCDDAGDGELLEKDTLEEDGHPVFRLKTDRRVVVLRREDVAPNTSVMLGDWTFESGDFQISEGSNNETLVYIQKFWNRSVAYNASLTKKDKSYEGELKVMDSECAKFKVGKCPKDLCVADGPRCKAADGVSHGTVTLTAIGDNDLERTVRIKENDPKRHDAKRSFQPVDAEMDAFVCVNLGNESWIPIRGMSYKQLAAVGSQSDNIKKAEETHGMKIFESKEFDKKVWLQEKHIIEDSIKGKGDFLGVPPWEKSIQATVEWKKAAKCPEQFPLCYKDGDCVLADCKSGCEWAKSPTLTSKDDLEYNYIAGADTFGTPCDISFEVMTRGGTSGLTLGAGMLALLFLQML